MTDDRPSLPSSDAWTPDGVIRVIRELAAHDVQVFSLRVESVRENRAEAVRIRDHHPGEQGDPTAAPADPPFRP